VSESLIRVTKKSMRV